MAVITIQLAVHKQEIARTEQDVASTHERLITVVTSVDHLENKVDEIEQERRASSVIFLNEYPESPTESAQSLVRKYTNEALHIDLNDNDITKCFRLRRRSNRFSKPWPILVSFASTSTKTEVLLAEPSTSSPSTKQLFFCHPNICSLVQQSDWGTRFDHLYNYVCRDNIYDVIALTETHLSDDIDDDEINLDGYTLFRLDRNRKGGGTALYCRSFILSLRIGAEINFKSFYCKHWNVKDWNFRASKQNRLRSLL